MNIKKITIFGGGTSGWLTAAYLINNLRVPVEVVLIEDSKLGAIGVGEGTQPATTRFLYECGIPPKMWMKDSYASFKMGVELVGWNNEPYFVDNDTHMNYYVNENLYVSDYFIDKDPSEFKSWHPAYQLAKSNISPKMFDGGDFNFNLPEGSYGAVHFSAHNIIETIKKLILNRITYIDTKIDRIESDDSGITKLICDDGVEYTSDLYLDCSGFKSLLTGEKIGVPFESFDEWLPCDRAIAIPTQYKNPNEECFPYTKSTTMSAGWRWTIPIYNRTGNGYVYSSKFISDEDAEKELRDAIGEYDAPANKLKMRCGRHKYVAHKNVCAIGLSAGFIEPLEATGITFTTALIKKLVVTLNTHGNFWTFNVKSDINDFFYRMSTEALTFIWAHYYFSSRNDTPFWKNIRESKIEHLPKDCQQVLSGYYPKPGRFMYQTSTTMFNVVQWFSMLSAGGAYKNVPSPLTEDQKKYVEYFIETQKHRVETAKRLFPNQHDYLKEWYNS